MSDPKLNAAHDEHDRPTDPRKPTETQLLIAIRDALLASGRVLLWRNNSGKLCDRTGRWVTFGLGIGSPDLVGILKGSGRMVAFEVKTPSGKLSPQQKAWHVAATKAGALVAVVRSVDAALDTVDLWATS